MNAKKWVKQGNTTPYTFVRRQSCSTGNTSAVNRKKYALLKYAQYLLSREEDWGRKTQFLPTSNRNVSVPVAKSEKRKVNVKGNVGCRMEATHTSSNQPKSHKWLLVSHIVLLTQKIIVKPCENITRGGGRTGSGFQNAGIQLRKKYLQDPFNTDY